MQTVAYSRIDEVSASLWDSVAPPDFFFRRRFLSVLEESEVENARYRYVVILDAGRPAGLAVLSRFALKLDLLSGNPWIVRLRRWLPSFLDVPMVCCGIPASFGQHHLQVSQPGLLNAAFDLVDREMEAWAAETRSGVLVWKEWGPGQGLQEPARARGYAVLPTLPDHGLAPLPHSVEAFLNALRSDYRRKYRAAVELMSNGAGPRWTSGPFLLEEAPFTPAAVPEFYRGYRRVMARTRVRLETYPEDFFTRLAGSDLDARTLRLTRRLDGESIAALLIPAGRALTFALVAKEKPRYDDGLYTALLQCIVLYAIRGGFAEIRLGQTSSYAKCSVGASPRRLETFIRMRGTWKQLALRRAGPLLFPEPVLPHLRVFKAAAVQARPVTTDEPSQRQSA